MFDCQYVMYVTNFNAFYILLISSMIHHRAFYVVLNFLYLIDINIIICPKWNLLAHIKGLYQSVKAYLLLLNNIFLDFLKQQNVFTNCNWAKFIAFKLH